MQGMSMDTSTCNVCVVCVLSKLQIHVHLNTCRQVKMMEPSSQRCNVPYYKDQHMLVGASKKTQGCMRVVQSFSNRGALYDSVCDI